MFTNFNSMFRMKAIDFFLVLKNGVYITKDSTIKKLPYSGYRYILIKKFEKADLIKTRKEGKHRLVYLTDKGLNLQKLLFKIKEDLNDKN